MSAHEVIWPTHDETYVALFCRDGRYASLRSGGSAADGGRIGSA